MNQTERLDLEYFLADLKTENQPLLFVPNSGNAGDALIGHATFQLFNRLGLNYECLVDYDRCNPSGRVVICAGGGNLVPLYEGTERVLRWAGGRARRVIILPHTVYGKDELLAKLGPEVDVICREAVSHRYVRDHVRAAGCHLADDMAFSLDVHKTLETEPEQPSQLALYAHKLAYQLFSRAQIKTIPSPWKLRLSDRLMSERRAALAGGEHSSRVLKAYRTDVERPPAPLPAGNVDAAQLFSHGTRNPHVCHTGSYHMLRFLETFEEVRTNRLHVCIGAALLGKQVRFEANNYYKNQAVFEFSIRSRYPSVHWVEAQADSPAGDPGD